MTPMRIFMLVLTAILIGLYAFFTYSLFVQTWEWSAGGITGVIVSYCPLPVALCILWEEWSISDGKGGDPFEDYPLTGI